MAMDALTAMQRLQVALDTCRQELSLQHVIADVLNHGVHDERRQKVEMMRALMCSNRRYNVPYPPMCSNSECGQGHCWYLHGVMDIVLWHEAWTALPQLSN